MKKPLINYLVVLVFTVILASCATKTDEKIRTNGPEIIDFKVLPFKLINVKLLDGPFKHATELDIKTLLYYSPDRLLSKFRTEAGLKPKALPYGGWEEGTLAGHSLGHYLTACCLMYQTTGDTAFLNRVNYIVSELDECQKQDSLGYISAIPGARKVFMEEVSKGNIRSRGFDLNGIWSPIYTQHKEMAGLIDAYQLCGNFQALEVAKKFAGWMIYYTDRMNEAQMQDMLNCEYGGINESLVELYGITKDAKYVTLANRFYHKAILEPLSQSKDILPGKHANTQIPKLIGLAREYELTADTLDRTTAEYFWERVVYHHTYATGGHCENEYFGAPDTLRNRLSDGTTETCNVYNMLKLSKHLFEWEAKPEVADFSERALFNQILSSQHSENGRVVYNLSLEMGGYKDFQDPEYFTCCIGTGMENHAKYGNEIYFHNNSELYVAQFIASELDWKEKGLKLKQTTNYPDEQGTSFEFESAQPQKLNLLVRYPYWAQKGITIAVNGKELNVKQKPGSFVSIDRTWKTGDKVEVKFPFTLHLESMPDDSTRVAVMYGPLVMAGDLGEIEDTAIHNPLYVPVLMANDRNPDKWFEPVAGQPNTFKSQNIGRPREIELKPFYQIHDRRYSVYWDLFTEERWTKFQAEYKAELENKKNLEAMTVDFFQPGEMQPERDHNFVANNSWVGTFRHRNFREVPNKWMSCEMKTIPNKPQALVITYWGAFPGAKTFDILVNDTKIATQNISNLNDGKFEDLKYPIPVELTKGKKKIVVKFQPHEGNRAPIFGVRVVQL